MKTSNISLLRYVVWRCIFKWLPFIAGFIMMCHCFLLLNNVHTLFIGVSFGISFLWALGFIAGSHALGFCGLHRAFTLYCLLITFCINYEASVGFGKYVSIARTSAFIIGILLHVLLLIKIIRKEPLSTGLRGGPDKVNNMVTCFQQPPF